MPKTTQLPTLITAYIALTLLAAIFGFFYAYVCSAMWGLDVVDPRTAIEAIKGINSEVRNVAFMPAFFLTPVALASVAALSWQSAKPAANWWVAAATIYLLGGLMLTMLFNVPMNEALAEIQVPESRQAAQTIWDEFSPDWQVYNLARTVFSGIAFGAALTGFRKLS